MGCDTLFDIANSFTCVRSRIVLHAFLLAAKNIGKRLVRLPTWASSYLPGSKQNLTNWLLPPDGARLIARTKIMVSAIDTYERRRGRA